MTDPRQADDDPVFLHSRREALVILGLWFGCMVYSLTVCYFLGYARDPAARGHVLGIPDWAFYGVFLPWGFADLFTLWFCFFYAKEDDLAPEEEGGGPSIPPDTALDRPGSDQIQGSPFGVQGRGSRDAR